MTLRQLLCLGSLLIVCAYGTTQDFAHPSPEFSSHSIINPTVYHARDKRQLHSTKKYLDSLEHHHDLTLKFNINGQERLLDLQLNRNLLPKNHFVKIQRNGTHVVNQLQPDELELCQYYGSLRHAPDSWAAISTCNGLRGVVFDGTTTHYIERTSDNPGHITGDHIIYSHENLIVNHTCGFEGTPHDVLNSFHRVGHIDRRKRSPQLIRGPYNANRNSRFVELILVVDHKLYEGMGKNIDAVHSHCKDIANIINALFVPLNIFIALVGVVVWTELDEIALSTKGDTTLTNFLHYRREKLVKEHPNDNAQLLSRVQFEGGVVGKALKGPICTYEFSGGVSMDHSPVVGLVATTVAHEMGHNFGMEHDTAACECPDDRCIMAPSSSSMSPTHWSSCSLSYLADAFEHGMDYCLRNRPERLFDSPVCGNGFVEPGEQCDCGLRDRCTNPCCNATTCMLHSNASCATGECCDLSTCHPIVAGTMCRSADHECDLPEYCTGESEYCPSDVFKMDGETCDWGKAFCYKGTCRSHTDQCRLLWGPSGKSSDFRCYRMNTKGSRHGNCGYNRLNQSYIKCYDENIYCGMLHCMHLSEKLEFGMESVAILSHSFINNGGSVIPCRTAMVDLGLNEVDPGLAPDGSKCADGKMCVGQRCLAVGSMMAGTECRDNCNGNGVCNSMGHCHCNTGFAPPFCYGPGTGGSEDSGPASQPNARKEVITAFYVVFLGIVPCVALVSFFVYYVKRNPSPFRRRVKKPHQRPTIHDKKPHNGVAGGPLGGRPAPSNLSSAGSRPFDSLLIPNGQTSAVDPSTDFQHSLIGRHDGFIITPIHHSQGNKAHVTPSRPAPRVPDRPAPASHQTDSTDGDSMALSPSRPAPQVPHVDIVHSSRPAPSPKPVPALTRIASFMRGQHRGDRKDRRPKIDREALRSLEISAPIMSGNETGTETRGAPVSRAQSMRDATVVKRPQLPSFGSMRMSNGGAAGKRPTSVPAAVRPTSPPPPRPPSANVSSHEYDDCLDRTAIALAPLAHIDEESPRVENIYAVIEENPKEIVAQEATLGLLGEIVSEIEARNTDSIYSAATLKRKKEKEKEAQKKAEKSSGETYVNTASWKGDDTDKPSSIVSSSGCSSSNSSNSGYLSPINGVNRPESIKPTTEGPSVPEKAAPYKPYSSSLVRSSGPFLASTSKPTTPLKRTKTPPSLFHQKSSSSSSTMAAPLTVSKPVVKPDLVSSCETPGNEPDVIGDKQAPSTVVVRGGVKPPVAKKKPAGASASTQPTAGNTATIRSGGAGGGPKVASLQAKFEAGKSLQLRGGSKEMPPASGVNR